MGVDLSRLWILLTLTAVACGQQQATGVATRIKGITISTHGSGQDWGTDRIVPCIEAIKEVGANWICVHPYARIHRSGRVTWRSFGTDAPPAQIVRPIREAHRLGLKVFIKPHLAYWGSPFKWRGEIAFEKPEQWWIVAVARASRDADGFAVGTELDKTIHKDKEWRGIIVSIRKVTKAPLTYAANWTDYTEIGFWDALDIIGIQAYFPLTNKKDAKPEELRAGWRDTMKALHPFATKHEKNIVFTELGYNTSFTTAIRPWEAKSDGEAAAAVQCQCMQIALDAVAAEPRVEGAFLWKWFPPPRPVGRNFPLATLGMKKIITAAWK